MIKKTMTKGRYARPRLKPDDITGIKTSKAPGNHPYWCDCDKCLRSPVQVNGRWVKRRRVTRMIYSKGLKRKFFPYEIDLKERQLSRVWILVHGFPF